MPNITEAINTKFGVAGANIAEALSQVAGGIPTDNIADAVAKLNSVGFASFTLDAVAAGTPAAMPTAETAYNSELATVAYANGVITITLSGEVKDLEDANHGSTWGTHKWLGFGVDTGLETIKGVQFVDDTGASATLGDGDISEATTLGLSAGEFILYIKAEDPKYLEGKKYFTLNLPGYKSATVAMKIVETKSE